MKKHCSSTSIPFNRLADSSQSLTEVNYNDQLNRAINSWATQRKAQIQSIPGVPPRERNRYRVILGNQILGTGLAIDQALALAKKSGELKATHNTNTLL